VIVQLIRTGHATHSVLGATLNESYTGDGAQIAASSRGSGRAVVPGGPAARAGLHAGDVVTKLGKLPITSSYALLDAVQSQAPGTTDAVTFLQHGQLQHGRLTLGSASS
jgi:putative serine protease PepD